jgi:hypothetical protein
MLSIKILIFISIFLSPLGAYANVSTPPSAFDAGHPRPDFARPDWQSLDGEWRFRFDPADEGLRRGWAHERVPFSERIIVPFSWAAPLSGQRDRPGVDVAWYARDIEVPRGWAGRPFLVVGASDWDTTVFLDGRVVGRHQGGYASFEVPLVAMVPGRRHRLVLRVDDRPAPHKLEAKQGYGPIRGIWQSVYLEARGAVALEALAIAARPDLNGVTITARLDAPAPRGTRLVLAFPNAEPPVTTIAAVVPTKARVLVVEVAMPGARKWSLADPFLHQVTATLVAPRGTPDAVETSFGMRTISVTDLPGAGHPYVALNGEPVYLQLALDQGFHPEGFFTFPGDDFVRDELVRARSLGLNGLRFHVKVESPRKLAWADRLGLLVMADVPNAWGPPVPAQRREIEHTLAKMIARDFNHPSIFAWVPFNETWGLKTKDASPEFQTETQEWVAQVYRRAKELDPTRLVEDHSPVHHDHVETDINSWHTYLAGWRWEGHLADVVSRTYPGSTWNFIGGRVQGRQPLFSSEFGNVWGYEGSTGDVDWSWDLHAAIDAFRRHPKIAGWIYTEHHDVPNEWNGYFRADRSLRETGLGDLVPGMTLADLHAPLYVAPGAPLVRTVSAGARVEIPLHASFLTARAPERLRLEVELRGHDDLGQPRTWPAPPARHETFAPFRTGPLAPLLVDAPRERAVVIVALRLVDPASKTVLHRNFTTLIVDAPEREAVTMTDGTRWRALRFAPAPFSAARFEGGPIVTLDGAKVAGIGAGEFGYRVPWPRDLSSARVTGVRFIAELSSRPRLGRDMAEAKGVDVGVAGLNLMRGDGSKDRSANPNAYPMTDVDRNPSAVFVDVEGTRVARVVLPDDPADHRGVLSWHAQLRDKKLRDAGTHGTLIDVVIPVQRIRGAEQRGHVDLRLAVDPATSGGLAVYGARFGRYPLSPTLLVRTGPRLSERVDSRSGI